MSVTMAGRGQGPPMLGEERARCHTMIRRQGRGFATHPPDGDFAMQRSCPTAAVDGKLAPALRNALQQFAKPWYRPRSLRVFRDDASL
jgi:hypothetical protein